MTETVDAPPATVPVLHEKVRQLYIARHNELMCRFPASLWREVNPDPVIRIQLSRGEVRGGRPVAK